MLGSLLRVLFVILLARFLAGLMTRLGLRRGKGPMQPHPSPRRPPKVAGEIRDAEFEDIGEGRR